MKHRVEYEIRWPKADEWAQAWGDFVHEALDEMPTSPTPGTVVHEDSMTRCTLQSGQHAQPGSTYHVETSDPPMGGAITVGEARQVVLDLEDATGEAKLRATLNSLDSPHVARARFEAPNVDVDGTFDHLDAKFLDFRARLPWLEVEATARIDDRPGDADGLLIVIDANGRGLWRPVVGTILTITHPLVRKGAHEVAKGIAEWCAQLPAYGFNGMPTAAPNDGIAAVEMGLDRLREDFHRVEEQLRLKPIWSRGANAWRHAYAELPSISLPGDEVLPTDDLGRRQTWAGVQSYLVDRILLRTRFGRRRCIDVEVEDVRKRMLATIESDQETWERMREPDTRPFTSSAPTFESLDTSWLATPWTTLRKITMADSDEEALANLRGLAEDV
ncbi:MAG: hypothetical protein V9G04_12295 [Nocardioides sp.]